MPKKSYNLILDEHLHVLITQGNHEAFERLKKRYRYHAINLCQDILKQNDDSGVLVPDLLAVCNSYFRFTVEKFVLGLSSFFSFWKQTVTHYVLRYLLDNSYTGEASIFRGVVSVDQSNANNHSFAELLCEIDDSKLKRKKIAEMRRIIDKHELHFTKQESTLLNMILDGYSIPDLEHSGVMSRSSLYLTFNIAIDKLQKLIDSLGNKK